MGTINKLTDNIQNQRTVERPDYLLSTPLFSGYGRNAVNLTASAYVITARSKTPDVSVLAVALNILCNGVGVSHKYNGETAFIADRGIHTDVEQNANPD